MIKRADTDKIHVAGMSRYKPVLDAAQRLFESIDPIKQEPGSIEEVARAIDAFMHTGAEPPKVTDNLALRAMFGKRFQTLGLYWTALGSNMDKYPSGEVGTGDAIDDFLDLWKEL